MLLGLALALRAPPRCFAPVMSAAPIGADGHTVDVDSAAIHARAKLGPTPDLTPAEVLETMLAAFQRGGDEDVEDLFQFVYPGGDLYQRHASPAGSMACFRWQIRREPRWQKVYARPNPDPNPNPNPNPHPNPNPNPNQVYARPCAMLLGMRSFEVVGSVMTDADVMRWGVRASPFFPDAPEAEAEAYFEFQLARRNHILAPGPTLS